MPVKKDSDGRRSVEAEVEVPGTPEDVWRAIATGPGISSWFVPTRVDEREGGEAVSSFGPGMDAVGTITAWNPPYRYVVEAEGDPGGEGPGKVATEWIVEARGGGTCVVRVVHSWFADSDDWDGEFEGHAFGWVSFFRMLRLFVTHHLGQSCSAFDLTAFSEAPPPETWRAVKSALTIDGENERVSSAPGAPTLSGAVVKAMDAQEHQGARETAPQIKAVLEGMGDEDPELLIRLERPAPGYVHMFVMSLGAQTLVSIRFFLFGDQAASAAAQAEREWTGWLAERFSLEPPQ